MKVSSEQDQELKKMSSVCCKTLRKPKQEKVEFEEDYPKYDAGWDKIFMRRRFSSGKVVREVLADVSERRKPTKKFLFCRMIHPYSTFSKVWVACSVLLMSYIAVMVPVMSHISLQSHDQRLIICFHVSTILHLIPTFRHHRTLSSMSLSTYFTLPIFGLTSRLGKLTFALNNFTWNYFLSFYSSIELQRGRSKI